MTDPVLDSARIDALEAELAAVKAKVDRLLRRFSSVEAPPPRQTYVNQIRNVFATTGRAVIPLAELVTLSGVSRPTANRAIAHFPDIFIRGRIVPEAGLRGRPAIVVARTPRHGETRPTHTETGGEILWDSV